MLIVTMCLSIGVYVVFSLFALLSEKVGGPDEHRVVVVRHPYEEAEPVQGICGCSVVEVLRTNHCQTELWYRNY